MKKLLLFMIILLLPLFVSATLTDGLVSYVPFNDGTIGAAIDVYGIYGMTGTAEPANIVGYDWFNMVSSSANMSSAVPLDEGYTVSMWLYGCLEDYAFSKGEMDGSGNAIAFGHQAAPEGYEEYNGRNVFSVYLIQDTWDAYQGYYFKNWSGVSSVGCSFNLTVPTHFIVTIENFNASLYVDSINIEQINFTDDGGAVDNVTTDNVFEFAGVLSSFGGDYYVKDFAVWDRILSGAEISELYANNGNPLFNGSGTAEDPYQVTSCTNLQEVNNDLSAYYLVMNDINCSDTVNWNSGLGFIPIGNATQSTMEVGRLFMGVFDGQGYTISGLFINRTTMHSGLFGASGGVIKNVVLTDAYVYAASNQVGILAGGINTSGIVYNCSSSGFVSGEEYVGGLVGFVLGSVYTSRSDAHVECIIAECGGLVGGTYDVGSIYDSYSMGILDDESKDATGGFLGYAEGSGIIYHVYTNNSIESSAGGGLIGSNEGLTIDNSYYDANTTGAGNDNGLGTPKSTAEMKTQGTFIDWDFDNIWQICAEVNDGYPSLIGVDDECVACTSNWSCSGYGACNISDLRPCNETVDLNVCGEEYSGDYSEFTPQACDYCAPDWSPFYQPTTCPSNSLWTKLYTDLNSCGQPAPGDNGTLVGCIYTPPVYESQTFEGKTTTDLNTVENISAVENFTIASSSGVVEFTSTVDLSNITNVEQIILVTSNLISVNVTAVPSLNTSADVILDVPAPNIFSSPCDDFNLYYSSGYYTTVEDIIANGIVVATSANIGGDCTDSNICTNVQCINGQLSFTAQHFDGFGVGLGTPEAVESCKSTQATIFAAFSIIALFVIVGAAFLIINMLKGGDFDSGLIIAGIIGFIAVAIVVFIGYLIISEVAAGICLI